MNASQGDSVCDCQATMLLHPNSFGNSTVWPRLETGNSSETPWSVPRTIACQVVMRLDASASTERLRVPGPVSHC